MDDGTTRVRMTADSGEWALFGLAATHASFVVEHPPEIVQLAADWGERFARSGRAGGARARLESKG